MQSWAWSLFKEAEGYDVIRMGIFKYAQLVGGALAYVVATPSEVNLMAIPDGPVLNWRAGDAEEMFFELIAALQSVSLQHKVITLRIEPRLVTCPVFLNNLLRSPIDLVPKETLEVSLGKEEGMFSAMKPKGRYNVRLADRHGVQTQTSTDFGDVDEFYEVFSQTARNQNFICEPKSFFLNLAQALFPDVGRFAFARYRGHTLAAAYSIRFGNMVTYLYGGHIPLFPAVMPSYGLHWHIMREAADENYQIYDLYGFVAAGTPENPYDRFSRFKEKFGGRHIKRIGSRDIIFYDRMADIAVEMIQSITRNIPSTLTCVEQKND